MPRSEVGRFPDVTLSPVHQPPPKGEEPNDAKAKEKGRHPWLWRLCPCFFRKPPGVPKTVAPGDAKMPDARENEPEASDMALLVRSVDLMKTNKDPNRKEHHTDHYQDDALIIRRGQCFQLGLELSRQFDPASDKLHLELKTGSQPAVSKNTHIIIPLVEELTDDRWESKIVAQDHNQIKLSVNSLPTAVIGRYELTVMTQTLKGEATSKHNPTNNIIILFNPWCEEDTVYMDDENDLKEYVVNDMGRLYYGTASQIGSRTWNFGQFHNGMLDTCLFVLEKSNLPPSGWGDPVNVVRIISAMVNSPDDNGVLEGNWSGDYDDGTAPTVWSGSVDILKQYYKKKGKPVKYGQCWVFSGVTTTVLRCLGIPTRSVTNFDSAHDTDVSLTTDVYFDENLEPIDNLNTDSIWNFHVWNESWMARPDLPAGMGGWQAVDATPQETSQGEFRCGPASLTAVRNGQVYLKYDAPFVFAEVNSDKIYWQRKADGTFAQIHSEKNAVGHHISTKAVGTDERADITNLYKNPENSPEERIAVETACHYGTKPYAYAAPTATDVSVAVSMAGEEPRMGGDAELTITLRNASASARNVALSSQVAVMYYTGVLKATVRKDQIPVELLPNEVKSLEWVLPFKDYQNQLVDQAALLMTLSGRVSETEQIVATQFSFRLRTPDIIITAVSDAVVGKEMVAEISFTNPLPYPLKNVKFRVEGLGLQSVREISAGNVESQATISLKESFVPTLPGPRKLLAALDCRQLTQVHGVANITVQEK